MGSGSTPGTPSLGTELSAASAPKFAVAFASAATLSRPAVSAPRYSTDLVAAAKDGGGNIIEDAIDQLKSLPKWVWAAAAYWYINNKDK